MKTFENESIIITGSRTCHSRMQLRSNYYRTSTCLLKRQIHTNQLFDTPSLVFFLDESVECQIETISATHRNSNQIMWMHSINAAVEMKIFRDCNCKIDLNERQKTRCNSIKNPHSLRKCIRLAGGPVCVHDPRSWMFKNSITKLIQWLSSSFSGYCEYDGNANIHQESHGQLNDINCTSQ